MIEVAIILLVVAGVPYFFYTYGILFGKKQKSSVSTGKPLPPITVIFSAYNEGKNIEKRLLNIRDCWYPYIHLIVVDDCSSDNTFEELKKWLVECNFSYGLIRNESRMGVSASYNKAIARAETEVVVLTDADVLFESGALHRIVERLISDGSIGAVTGDLQPDGARFLALAIETPYRSVYGDMCQWESAHDSTFNFNGALIAFKRSATSVIPKNGADDANLAFATIRNGYRAVYDLESVVYERIPDTIGVQYRQKVRRAHGILTAMWSNKDLLAGHRIFTDFYVMRMWMYFVSPALFFLGVLTYPPFIVAVIILMISSMFRSFVFNQFYLLCGLLPRETTTWDSISGATK